MIALGRGGRKLRIGYGRIFHEACADSPLPTNQASFERMGVLRGSALAHAASLKGAELESFFPHAELTGFVQAARLAGGVEAVPLSSAFAVPSGPITRECFEWLVSALIAEVRAAGALDGIYLALHGSMEVEGLGEAPEAVILRRVREAAGLAVKIAASYDLHGNLAPDLVDPLEILVAYRTNPHWDLAPTGFRAGNLLIRALRGQIQPVHAWRKLPIVVGGGTTIDFLQPMRKVFRAMKRMLRSAKVLATSFFVVHPFTSATDLGWAVHVTTDGDVALAERLADELADLAWATRTVPLPPMLEVDEALDKAAQSFWRKLGPVTLVDSDDIVGAGAPGGSTRIVAALCAHDRALNALVPVHDPAALALTWDLPIGTKVDLILRGTPGYDQPEVPISAVVGARAETSLGRRVRLDVGSFHVAVSEHPPLPIHPRFWRELGVSPRKADVMVQKNFFHYRIFHIALSFQHIPVISRGATSLRRAAAKMTPVPCYPTANPADWRDGDLELRTQARPARQVA